MLYYLANLSKALSKDPSEVISPPSNQKTATSLVLESETDDNDILTNFPQDLFPDSQYYLGIYHYLKELHQSNGAVQEDTAEDTQLKRTICDKVFAIFLYRISRHVTAACFRELCVFVCLFRKTLNIKGWEMKRQQIEKKDPGREVSAAELQNNIPFCECNTAEFALEVSNDFIIEFFPKYLKEVKMSEFRVLGEDEEKLKNVVYLTQHFCNWLFTNYYTNSRLSLNLN